MDEPTRRPVPSWLRSRIARVRAFTRLARADQIAVAYVAAVSLVVDVGLRLLPVPRLSRLLGAPLVPADGSTNDRGPSSPSPSDARLRAVDRIARAWPARGRCLRKALIVGHLLRAQTPCLRIGIAREDGRVHAHAWIEIDGAPFAEDVSGYVPLNPSTHACR